MHGKVSEIETDCRGVFSDLPKHFSVTRYLRDALSSSVMINNDRILGNVASAALLLEVPALLTD